ncbi:hypothetical protein BDV95DRAFT_388033 [Massariosphaeria phaeospora]|uniref:Uncharacterized protein n=1 Tax=Massariosphaeria phaeospora TaxID=100035 RepID=A0A7C8M9Y8_9PLEO|nr:hypothetical protein BDV95DRAFT_388033 [Massariosphaeria phaeospora]
MSRTVELGRAVLCSPDIQHELWLTTLITISPQQNTLIDLQGLRQSVLVELLLSGNAWVGRGCGMHLLLELTLEREPIARPELAVVAENVINAPAWDQLNFPLSLPHDGANDSTSAVDYGKLRINVGHAREANTPAQSHLRMSRIVTAANATPPEGVPGLALESVRFIMDIVRTRSSVLGGGTTGNRTKRTKQPSCNSTQTEVSTPLLEHDDAVVLFDELCGPSETPQIPCSPRRKRKHSTSSNVTTKPMPTFADSSPSTDSHTQPEGYLSGNVDMLTKFVDSTIRLSVCSSLARSATGMKVKTKTFSGCLADVAPCLWRPGFLTALSQRAQFLPTIGRSLVRTVGSRPLSRTMQEKYQRLNDGSTNGGPSSLMQSLRPDDAIDSHLWIHLQKSLVSKISIGSFGAFCQSRARLPPDASFDDMLDDTQAENERRPPESSGQADIRVKAIIGKEEGLHSHQSPGPNGDDDLFTEKLLGEESHFEIDYGDGEEDDDILLCPIIVCKEVLKSA